MTLIEILKNETKSLKKQFLQLTESYCKNYFKICEERSEWKEVDWCKYLGITPAIRNQNTSLEFSGFPKGFYNTKEAKTLNNLRNSIYGIMSMGLEKFIQKELVKAKNHYENSIIKLAKRIEKKGLDQTNLKVVTSHIGVNIETTLTDGQQTVRAWTIIASGPVQRPHYRYLVK